MNFKFTTIFKLYSKLQIQRRENCFSNSHWKRKKNYNILLSPLTLTQENRHTEYHFSKTYKDGGSMYKIAKTDYRQTRFRNHNQVSLITERQMLKTSFFTVTGKTKMIWFVWLVWIQSVIIQSSQDTIFCCRICFQSFSFFTKYSACHFLLTNF